MDPSDTTRVPVPPVRPVPPTAPNSVRVEVDFGAATHAGLVRTVNEDCYLVARLDRQFTTISSNVGSPDEPEDFDEVIFGLLVADGLGGAKAGEVASRLAVRTFVDHVIHTPDWIMRVDETEAVRVEERIVERFRRAGAAITREAARDESRAGMGTTLTLACSSGIYLFVGHVGDSRVYLLRGGELTRLTRDHTYAQSLADAGFIGADEVEGHQLSHVLIRALGVSRDDVAVDVRRHLLLDGDVILACTDGLTNMVPHGTIQEILRSNPAAEASRQLVDAALAAGGLDNVTVVVARYLISPPAA